MTQSMDTSTVAQVLQFRYPDKPGRWSDRQRILRMYEIGEISAKIRDQWLRNGGHE